MKITVKIEGSPFCKGDGLFVLDLDKRVKLNSRVKTRIEKLNGILKEFNDGKIGDAVLTQQAIVYYRFVEFLEQIATSIEELTKMKGVNDNV